MKLRDLEYILTIAELKSFVKAAERCNVSQSTLSIQLKKVEEYLGVQIFERTNKAVMLTRVGEEICLCAKVMLQESQKIKNISKKNKDPLAGDLYLGSFPTMGPYIFPKLIAIFFDHFPKTQVYFVEEKAETLANKLEEGVVDCALIGLPVERNNMVSVELFWEPYYLAVPIRHRLAQKESIVMGDIRDERLLLLEEEHCLTDHILHELCTDIGIGRIDNYRATSLETLKNMVAIGTGVTIIPGIAIPEEDKNIAYIPFESKEIGHSIGLAWRNTSHVNEICLALCEIMKKMDFFSRKFV